MRLGRFVIDRKLLATDVGRAVFAGLVPVDLTHRYHLDQTEICAIGDCFDEVVEGQIIPNYIATIEEDDGNLIVTWTREAA